MVTWIHGCHINAGEVKTQRSLFSCCVLDIKAVLFVTVIAAMAFTYVRETTCVILSELIAESSMDWRNKQLVSEACYAS